MRIRTIKPEWLQDEKIASVSDAARVLSIGLILMSDDYGNGRAHEQFIASQVWTYGESHETLMKVSRGLQELKDCGFVEIYEVNNQSYFHVKNWEKHQKVQHPGKPLVPPHETLTTTSGDSHETLTPDPDQDLNQRPGPTRESSEGNEKTYFQEPSQDREWMQVVKAYTEVTGLPVAAHYQENDAKAILALAKQIDDKSYLEIIQRALKGWWADEWTQKHSLPLSNLVKNFAKFAGANGKKPQGLDYTSKLRLIELPEIIKDIKFSLEHAEDCGDQVAMEKHQRNLNKVAKEYDSLREMDR
jgi:hypothetical protein